MRFEPPDYIPFYNATEETIPPFALMAYDPNSDVKVFDGVPCIPMMKPNAELRVTYYLNGPGPVQPNSQGNCNLGWLNVPNLLRSDATFNGGFFGSPIGGPAPDSWAMVFDLDAITYPYGYPPEDRDKIFGWTRYPFGFITRIAPNDALIGTKAVPMSSALTHQVSTLLVVVRFQNVLSFAEISDPTFTIDHGVSDNAQVFSIANVTSGGNSGATGHLLDVYASSFMPNDYYTQGGWAARYGGRWVLVAAFLTKYFRF